MTFVKYECDSMNLPDTFAKATIVLTEKLAKWAQVTITTDALLKSAVITPVRGEWDLMGLSDTFTKVNMSLSETIWA